MKTRWLAILAAWAAGTGLGLAALASCTVQPIGWQGAGRMQELPEIQMDGGGAMLDSGVDAVDTGIDTGVDTGIDTGVDSGVDSGP